MRDCGFHAGQRVTGPMGKGRERDRERERERERAGRLRGGKHRREMEKNSAPSTCPSMRDGVRGSYIYAIHYVFG